MAARGKLSDKIYPWGDTIDGSFANYNGSGDNYEIGSLPLKTPISHYNGSQTPTGGNRANAYGLYDVVGNVSEWVFDFYDVGWYRDEGAALTDPRGPDAVTYRVIRGGSWGSTTSLLGVANRDFGKPSSKSNSGFRCVRSK